MKRRGGWHPSKSSAEPSHKLKRRFVHSRSKTQPSRLQAEVRSPVSGNASKALKRACETEVEDKVKTVGRVEGA